MKVEISYETIGEMLEIFTQLKEEKKADREKLARLLDHRDYQVEFERYGRRVSKEDFLNFVCDFYAIEPDKIENQDILLNRTKMSFLN